MAEAQRLDPAVWPDPRAIDEARLQALGIRIVRGTNVWLVTDLPASDAIDRLPDELALAVPQLANYFRVPKEKLDGWRVQAYLVRDKNRFIAAGLMPPKPYDAFPHGLSMGYELWVNDQDSDYYRRALLLHELTHSFMATQLGGCGPGWYMEAVAEQMGAHRLSTSGASLRIGQMPATREAAPLWGRVPLVRQTPVPLTLEAVMKIDNRESLPVKSYAVLWALARFMDSHPRYQERWRKLPRIVLQQDFNDRFRRGFASDWKELNTEFSLFASTLEYGHDIVRESINFRPGVALEPRSSRQTVLAVDRGWQPSGVALVVGQQYRYQASGQYVIAHEPDGTPWPCEAGGVTLDYHGGRPLGQLLAAIDTPGGFLRPIPLGVEGQFRASANGTLYLRVNDSPAKLKENKGELQVTITAVE